MKYAVTTKLHDLAQTLESLKSRVREAMAGEMAKAVGSAVRDVLMVSLCDQFATTVSGARSPDWREEREGWEEDDYSHWRNIARSAPVPPLPAAAAIAVGVHVGRWWFRKQGDLPLSLGLGTLATVLGISGGTAARAVLAVVSAGVDLLTADTDLSR